MSHLDEGTLHALLDGELDNHEVREIQAHLGSCSACGTRLQSVKDILAESDRLVGAIQFPGTPSRPAALDPVLEPEPLAPPPAAPQPPAPAEFAAGGEYEPPAPHYDPPTAFEPPPSPRIVHGPERRIDPQPIYDEPPPMLLVPDDNQWAERRRRLLTMGRWAALLAVMVGAGFIASEVRQTGGVAVVSPASPDSDLADDRAAPVVSAEETSRPENLSTPLGKAAETGATGSRPAPAPARKTVAPKTAPESRPAAPPPAREDAASLRLAESREEQTSVNQVANEQADAGEDEAVAADVREEAAQALAELDRQRRADRAAAATAALDSQARRRAAATRGAAAATPAPAPVAAPAPRTLEQRSGIYLRIGLDEAARQLGRPVHVVEGMQQQFMGLAQGAASPGAEPGRPVVRVVYQDNQGRMILLDQQRIRPGQGWAAGDTRWVVGEIGLSLLGEPGPEILRNLRPRVR